MPELKQRSWENMEVGEEFGPMEVVVDDHKLKSFCFALDDFDPKYMGGNPRCERVGMPGVLCNDLLRVPQTRYDFRTGAGTGLHAKQEWEVFRPIKLGEKATITGRYVDKYIKRDKQYVVLEAEAKDEKGKLILRGKATQMRSLKPGVVKEGPAAPAAEQPTPPTPTIISGVVLEKADRNTPVGAQVKPIVKEVTQNRMSAFTGADRLDSIHTNAELARSRGLANTVAQGLMSANYVAEVMTNFFGDGFRKGGKVAVAFISPVYPGDTITASAVVKEKKAEGKATRLEMEVWCENQAGKRVTVGTASGLVK